MFQRTRTGTIGEGGYGRVYAAEGEYKGKVTKLAIKRNFSDKNVAGTQNLRELSILYYLTAFNFPYVAKLTTIHFNELPFKAYSPHMCDDGKDSKFKDDTVHYEFERATGDVSLLITRAHRMTSVDVRSIMYQMALSIAFCQSKDIVHRDIKPSNFLFYDDMKHDLPGPLIRLTDFGMSYYQNATIEANSPRCIMTWCYRAPEVCMEYDYYDAKIDVFSLGIVFTELCSKNGRRFMDGSAMYRDFEAGRRRDEKNNHNILKIIVETLPFPIDDEDHDYIVNHEKLADEPKLVSALGAIMKEKEYNRALSLRHFNYDESFKDLLRNMLHLDPERRPSIKEVLSHPFFESINTMKDFSRDLEPYDHYVYTLQDSPERELLLRVYGKLYYSSESPSGVAASTRIFLHMHEFISRIFYQSNPELNELRDNFDEDFVLTVYYMFDKFFNIDVEYCPESSLSRRNEELEINSERILEIENRIIIKSRGDLYRPTIFEKCEEYDFIDIWNFVWVHKKRQQRLSSYIEEFKTYTEENGEVRDIE